MEEKNHVDTTTQDGLNEWVHESIKTSVADNLPNGFTWEMPVLIDYAREVELVARSKDGKTDLIESFRNIPYADSTDDNIFVAIKRIVERAEKFKYV